MRTVVVHRRPARRDLVHQLRHLAVRAGHRRPAHAAAHDDDHARTDLPGHGSPGDAGASRPRAVAHQRARAARMARLVPAQLDHPGPDQPVLRLLHLRAGPLWALHDAPVRLPHGQPRRPRRMQLHFLFAGLPLLLGADRHRSAAASRCRTGATPAAPAHRDGRARVLLRHPDDGHDADGRRVVRHRAAAVGHQPAARHPAGRSGGLGGVRDPQPDRAARDRRSSGHAATSARPRATTARRIATATPSSTPTTRSWPLLAARDKRRPER